MSCDRLFFTTCLSVFLRSWSGLHRVSKGCYNDATADGLGHTFLHNASAAGPRQSG